MRRLKYLLLLFLIIPFMVSGLEVSNTDITDIEFSDDWIVVTRDNYNDVLKEQGYSDGQISSTYSMNSSLAIFSRNTSGVIKKYSTPSCSVPRGAREVHEIEKERFNSGCSCISHLMIVLFPLPLGAEIIISFPFFDFLSIDF